MVRLTGKQNPDRGRTPLCLGWRRRRRLCEPPAAKVLLKIGSKFDRDGGKPFLLGRLFCWLDGRKAPSVSAQQNFKVQIKGKIQIDFAIPGYFTVRDA
jgi:hypothetical protein